jgi:hypothetical protein
LYFVAFMSVATMGTHYGLSGTRTLSSALAPILSFAVLMLLIVDLDRPRQHLFSVTQSPLADTLEMMRRTPQADLGRPP